MGGAALIPDFDFCLSSAICLTICSLGVVRIYDGFTTISALVYALPLTQVDVAHISIYSVLKTNTLVKPLFYAQG